MRSGGVEIQPAYSVHLYIDTCRALILRFLSSQELWNLLTIAMQLFHAHSQGPRWGTTRAGFLRKARNGKPLMRSSN